LYDSSVGLRRFLLVLIFGCALFVVPNALAGITPTFASHVDYATGTNPRAIVTGDVNGDGIPDLVVTNKGIDKVSVRLGVGDGTFGSEQTFTTAVGPNDVALADLNGDGELDIATVERDSSQVSVLLGNGDGTFQAKVDYATGNGPISIAIADVNHDGDPDLVTTNLDDAKVSVLLGDPNDPGTFQAKVDYVTDIGPYGLAVKDVNGDGYPDIVSANGQSSDVSVLLGDPNNPGTFQAKQDFATGAAPVSVAVSDVNGDGKPDLVTANLGGDSASLLLGNGDGTFQAKVDYTTGASPASVSVADVNGDARPDLVTADSADNTASLLLGNGDGTFRPRSTLGVGAIPLSVTVADLNGDGAPDLATANPGDNTDSVLLQTSSHAQPGTLAPYVNYATAAGGATYGPNSVATGDFNGDGKPDVVSTDQDVSKVSVLLGNGDGTLQTTADYATGAGPHWVVSADLNGDGKLDLATANTTPNTVSVLIGNGDGTFQAHVDYGTGGSPFSVAVADLNHDGKSDLVTANLAGTVSVLLGNGDGTFQAKTDIDLSGGSFFPPELLSVAIADVNRDGKPDVMASAQDPFGSSNSVYVLLGNGNGTFQAPTQHATASDTGNSPMWVAVGDVNGDGKPDLVTNNRGSQKVSVLLGNGDGTFQAHQDYPAGPGGSSGPTSVAIADVNGDGKPDLVTSNDIGSVSVLLGSGDGTFPTHTEYAAGPGQVPWAVAIADLNRDGMPDVVTANYLGPNFNISVLLQYGALDHFAVEKSGGGSIGTQTAGTSFNVNVTAQDDVDNTVSGFTGTADISSNRTCIAGCSTTAAFSSGVLASHAVTLTKAGTAATLTATKTGGSETGKSNGFTVSPAALDHVTFTQLPHPLVSGTQGTLKAELRDAYQNKVDSSAQVTFSKLGGAGTVTGLPASVAAVHGVASTSVTGVLAGLFDLQAAAPGATAASKTFGIVPGPASQLVYTSGTATLKSGRTRAITVHIEDVNGNRVNTSRSVTFAQSAGTGSVTGVPVTVAAVHGVATATVTCANAGSVTVRATSPSPGPALTAATTTFQVAP
jgi:FG-GAP-like repeat/FG-GAP repeat